MPDTRRELAALQALYPDNAAGDISAQDLRDGVQSVHPDRAAQAAAYASEPATGQVTGDLFFPTDGAFVERYDGSAWKPFGPVFPLVKPADPGTWVNQGSAVLTATKGLLNLSCVASASANNAKLRVKTAPAAPYTITALFRMLVNFVDNAGAGLGEAGMCFRESGTGKVVTYGPQIWNGQVAKFVIAKWDSATALNSTYFNGNISYSPHVFIWIQLINDNTNLVMKMSPDGQNWLTIHSVAKANFFTTAPDQVGFYVNPYACASALTVFSSDL